LSVKSLIGLFLGVCVSLCCADTTVTSHEMHQITATQTTYNYADAYYSTSASNGVRFYFVAPNDGAYQITFSQPGHTSHNDIYRYNSNFDYYFSHWWVNSSAIDTIAAAMGDTIFYKVDRYYYNDTLFSISTNYKALSLTSYSVQVTSSSPNCSVPNAPGQALSTKPYAIHGVGEEGYRGNGWKIKVGSSGYKISDSTANDLAISLYGDTEIEFQCVAGKINDVQNKLQTYSPDVDYYQGTPRSGVRFRYTVKDTNLNVVQYKTGYMSAYIVNFGTDSLFKTPVDSSYSSSRKSIPVKAEVGDKRYYIVYPTYQNETDEKFRFGYQPSAVVHYEYTSRTDTIAIGDTITPSPTIPADSQLVGWYVASGKGSFSDTLAAKPRFVPASSEVTIGFKLKQGAVYELTDKKSYFSFAQNTSGTKTSYRYGIRTKFVAPDSGTYSLIVNTKHSLYLYTYETDSLFGVYDSYTNLYSDKAGYAFSAEKGKTYYFLLQDNSYPHDSIAARVEKPLMLEIDTVGTGSTYVSGNLSNYDNTYVKGDSITLGTSTTSPNKFLRWEHVSGSCTVLDTLSSITRVVIESDCKIRAVFGEGQVYNITPTISSYIPNLHSFGSNGDGGIRFRFVAPDSGTYVIAFTRLKTNGYYSDFYLYKYSDDSYSKQIGSYRYVSELYKDTVKVNGGDTLRYVVQSPPSYTSVPVWVNYSLGGSAKLVLETDPAMGYVTPKNGYDSLTKDVPYTISATGYKFYRFDHWKVIKGKTTILDTKSKSTMAVVSEPSKVRAVFTKGPIQTLTSTKKEFLFEEDYNNDNNSYKSVFFKWIPEDTITYMGGFKLYDSVGVQLTLHGPDSTFSKQVKTIKYTGKQLQFKISGKTGVPQYLQLALTSNYSVLDTHSFAGSIKRPYVMSIRSSEKGVIYPTDEILVHPGFDTTITSKPQGGYAFKQWTVLDGEATFADSSFRYTKVRPESQKSIIKANYEIDTNLEPNVGILSLDLNSYPGVCATVSVTDKNTDKSIIELGKSSFEVFQDDDSVGIQASSVNKVGGVSVALVVDESSSMSGSGIEGAKASITQFITEMSEYDRTAIVGFSGGSSYTVHQTMTSDKSLLMAAVERLSASGTTNINTGAYHGVMQVQGETNPTAVIIFSDGNNLSESTTPSDVINLAHEYNTTIHSIAVGGSYEIPLKELAEKTGGSFTVAPSATDLSRIYDEIREEVQTRYLVCFNTPDVIADGDTHIVHIGVRLHDMLAIDTATWDENFMPPSIRLADSTKALVGQVRHEGKGFAIEAFVFSKLPLESTKIYIKKSSLENTTYTAYEMDYVSDSLWRFEVTDSMVVGPGLDFYISSTDSTGMIGLSPSVFNAAAEPYTIPIDNEPPFIEQTTGRCAIRAGIDKSFIDFNIIDEDGINSARFYYKRSSDIIFEVLSMENADGSDHWSAIFPTSIFDEGSIEYYVRATDNKGVNNRWELFKNSRISLCEEKDDPEEDDWTFSDADKAEIYDKDLDGRADFVRIHFKSPLAYKIYKIDSLFWNMDDEEDWREVYKEDLSISEDLMWIEASIDPFDYGLTAAEKPYLRFTKERRDSTSQKVSISDKVGAVITRVIKHPGVLSLENYMDGDSEIAADTLEVTLSEPITAEKSKNAWKDLFRYTEFCDDTTSHAVNLKNVTVIDSAKGIWRLILADHNIEVGHCLITDINAPYKDQNGNSMGRGGVEIVGEDGIEYLRTVKPNPPVAGTGKEVKWIPAEKSEWATQPDTISAIEIWSIAPYKAKISIFDGAASVIATFSQKFGYDGEMDMASRSSDDHRYKLGYLSWDQHSNEGRKVGTGVYIWRIDFKFKDGHSEYRLVKTGVKRKKD